MYEVKGKIAVAVSCTPDMFGVEKVSATDRNIIRDSFWNKIGREIACYWMENIFSPFLCSF
jgi:hypothetical protein